MISEPNISNAEPAGPAGLGSTAFHGCITADSGATAPERRVFAGPDEFAKLIVAIGEGNDRVSFAALFEYFAPRVKGYMSRRGAMASVAEDIAQETLLTVWRKARQFEPSRASAAAWIFTIARNLAIDGFRRAGAGPAWRFDEIACEASPEDALIEAEGEMRVRQAMDTLPPEQSEILTRAYFGHRSHSQIALDLGIPLGTVKSRIRLATAQLRSTLEDR